MTVRISTLDSGYVVGDLSVYPEAIDDKEILYEVKNNAETKLKQSLTYNARLIIVEDASSFPPKGLLRIGPRAGEAGNAELIYYGQKIGNIFKDLCRGFAGSRQDAYSANNTFVTNAVMAEHHNAVKDAIINIENNIGLKNFPSPESLNGILKNLENRVLAPKPTFRAFPTIGDPPLDVRFQNFSGGDVIRFLWDFGDGSTSIEKSPNHIYQTEGVFTVKLNVITSTGAQGIGIKSNYITVSEEETTSFFYVVQEDPSMPPLSQASADTLNSEGGFSPGDPGFKEAAVFDFVDQTDGEISQRFWVFGDGTTQAIIDPDIHSTTHVYEQPGTYKPSELIIFANQQLNRVFLEDTLIVL